MKSHGVAAESPKRIIVTTQNGAGDVVFALPAMAKLRRDFPDAKIDVMSKPSNIDLVRQHPAVSKVIERPRKRPLRSIPGEAKKLAAEGKYNLAVNMSESFGALAVTRLASRRSFGKEGSRDFLTRQFMTDRVVNQLGPHKIQSHMNLVNAVSRCFGGVDQELTTLDFGELGPNKSLDMNVNAFTLEANQVHDIALIPDSSLACKNWPQERWEALVQQLAQDFPNAKFHVVGGSPVVVEPLASKLAIQHPGKIKLHNQPPWLELPDLFRSMQLIIGMDTGPTHIAAASVDPNETRIIGLYGPTPIEKYRPFGFETVSATKLHEDLELPQKPPRDKSKWPHIDSIEASDVLKQIHQPCQN